MEGGLPGFLLQSDPWATETLEQRGWKVLVGVEMELLSYLQEVLPELSVNA